MAGLNRGQLDAFIRTKKGRKTEHIVGIVQVCNDLSVADEASPWNYFPVRSLVQMLVFISLYYKEGKAVTLDIILMLVDKGYRE